jgi:hypothetical protein
MMNRIKFCFQIQLAPLHRGREWEGPPAVALLGRAVQVDIINIRVEGTFGFSA